MSKTFALGLLLVLLLSACSAFEGNRQAVGENQLPVVTVYKSPT